MSFPDAARALDLKEEEVRRLFAVLHHLELLKAAKREHPVLMTMF